MTLTITIPGLPPRECSPNARVHWIVKAKHAAHYRETVRIIAQSFAREYSRTESATSFVIGQPPARALVDVTFIVPDKRRRDKTNYASAFKAGLDGLVDAGVIVDDSHEHIDDQYHIVYEKGKSMTIVEVTGEYEPKTPLGAELLRIRNKAIAGGMELLSEDELEALREA